MFLNKKLQKQGNCGLQATRARENKRFSGEKLPLLSTTPANLFSVAAFDLIRTREKREGNTMAKAALKTKSKAKAKRKPMKRTVAKKRATKRRR